MPHVSRDGVRLYYEDSGGHGEVLFMTHGFGSSSRTWEGQLGLTADFRVICWDMRGHAQSDSPGRPEDYSKQHQVDDMLAVLDACGVQSAIFVGHSMGGFDSLLFMLRSPQHAARVRALVLVSAGPGFVKAEAREQWNMRAQAMGANFEAKGLEALVGSDRSKGHSEQGARVGLAHAARRVYAQLDDDPLLTTMPGKAGVVATNLHLLKLPVLIIVGERDKQFRRAAEMMASKVPGAKLTLIAGAGHMVHEVAKESFNEALRSFCFSIRSPPARL
eukprot:TRINITY_DN81709_c0_g1_i1.p1 TRINITY_DN81709_c0_g1~~TRINITY_DN81709_c0_g1_i1.p1  ORF type:complete len:275 (-),score=56.35 TRINITY_DN81709_c0_g1_i1:35-859(-)